MGRTLRIAMLVLVILLLAGVLWSRPSTWGTSRGATSNPLVDKDTVGAADSGRHARLPSESGKRLEQGEEAIARSYAARFDRAMAWVEAHRPSDWPYAQCEASTLAMWESNLTDVANSPEELLRFTVEKLRTIDDIDVDGSGSVDDAELERIAMFYSELELQTHPYFVRLYDSDGDGVLSWLDEGYKLQPNDPFAKMPQIMARVMLDAFDADDDGVLDPEEEPHEIPDMEDGSMMELVRPWAEATWVEPIADIRAMADQFESRRGIDLSSEIYDAAPHDPDDVASWRSRRQRARGQRNALYAKARFEIGLETHDVDGDGLLSPAEAEARIDDLAAALRRNLVMLTVDVDESGVVETEELERFLRLYETGSLRADATWDGRVDQSDVQAVIDVRSEVGP